MRSETEAPVFSVIVPVFEQWRCVPRLLQALREQGWSGAFETILIDNGSRSYAPPAALPPRTRILHCDRPGSYAARNTGIAVARGHWLLFTDADCVPAADWLERMAEALARHGDRCLLAGAVEVVAEGGDPLNRYQIYDMVKGIPQAHYVRRGYAATANLCVPKAIIDSIGTFDRCRPLFRRRQRAVPAREPSWPRAALRVLRAGASSRARQLAGTGNQGPPGEGRTTHRRQPASSHRVFPAQLHAAARRGMALPARAPATAALPSHRRRGPGAHLDRGHA